MQTITLDIHFQLKKWHSHCQLIVVCYIILHLFVVWYSHGPMIIVRCSHIKISRKIWFERGTNEKEWQFICQLNVFLWYKRKMHQCPSPFGHILTLGDLSIWRERKESGSELCEGNNCQLMAAKLQWQMVMIKMRLNTFYLVSPHFLQF